MTSFYITRFHNSILLLESSEPLVNNVIDDFSSLKCKPEIRENLFLYTFITHDLHEVRNDNLLRSIMHNFDDKVLKKKDNLKNVTKILSLIYKLFTGMLSIYNKLCIHYNTINPSFTA